MADAVRVARVRVDSERGSSHCQQPAAHYAAPLYISHIPAQQRPLATEHRSPLSQLALPPSAQQPNITPIADCDAVLARRPAVGCLAQRMSESLTHSAHRRTFHSTLRPAST